MTPPVELSKEEARRYMVGHHGLFRDRAETGAEGVRALLAQMRCIQLDPLDRIGTNADLVALARVRGIRCGDVYDRLMPGHAFEHFAKERCLLPAESFPHYRCRLAEDGYRYRWHGVLDMPDSLVAEVYAEIEERGPITPGELSDRGRLTPPKDAWLRDTIPANSVAVERLWSRCEVVVCGRSGNHKVYDIPRRALPEVWDAEPAMDFDRWALLERVEAAGLMSMSAGPLWSLIKDVRSSELPMQLVEEGLLELVIVEGAKRRYLAPAGFRDRAFSADDGRLRILGPLDPLMWDRQLVRQIFGFDYVWEVYKPRSQRTWGYYVVPILHRGRLVARFEGRRSDGRLLVENLWVEDDGELDTGAWKDALRRHEGVL